MDGVYDLGGLQGFGPVVTADGELTHHHDWELRAQAIAMMIGGGSVRPWIERIAPPKYLTSAYYERWLIAAEHAVTERGDVTIGELDEHRRAFACDGNVAAPRHDDSDLCAQMSRYMTHVRPMTMAEAPRFAPADRVRVRPALATERNRCPRYLRGVAGQIERVCGADRLPSSDEHETLYTVEFASTDVWGTNGEPPFTVLVDLFEHYLEPDRGA